MAFQRAPTDRTGELVRLLDDLASATQSIATYVAQAGNPPANSSPLSSSSSPSATLDVALVTRKLYETLCHDGYACLIVEAHRATPLTFAPSALHGGYIVSLSALDATQHADDGIARGTTFSVYRRNSSPSVPGCWVDVQQRIGNQVAAGTVVYSSTTHLMYTLGRGAFSFHMHPVASQYFMFSDRPCMLPMQLGLEHRPVYADYSHLRRRRLSCPMARGLLAFIDSTHARVLYNSSAVADFDAAMQCGAVILRYDLDLLCVAGCMALLAEQMNGKATNGFGTRILGKFFYSVLFLSFYPFSRVH